MTVTEIAKALGISKQYVSKLLYAAYGKIRKALGIPKPRRNPCDPRKRTSNR